MNGTFHIKYKLGVFMEDHFFFVFRVPYTKTADGIYGIHLTF